MPREVTDRSFAADVLEATSPVVVDFWAAWCGPCLRLAPVVEELAQEYRGRVEFLKLNVDENPRTAAKYGIRSIPTLLVFKGGKVVDLVVGALPKGELKKHIDAVVASSAPQEVPHDPDRQRRSSEPRHGLFGLRRPGRWTA